MIKRLVMILWTKSALGRNLAQRCLTEWKRGRRTATTSSRRLSLFLIFWTRVSARFFWRWRWRERQMTEAMANGNARLDYSHIWKDADWRCKNQHQDDSEMWHRAKSCPSKPCVYLFPLCSKISSTRHRPVISFVTFQLVFILYQLE